MTNEIKITATVRQIMDAKLWEDYCRLTGTNPWAVNEGMPDDETVTVPPDLVMPLLEWSKRAGPNATFPKRCKLYLHGDRERNWETGERIGLSEEAIRENFRFALYEVEFELEVKADGTYKLLTVDGKALAA